MRPFSCKYQVFPFLFAQLRRAGSLKYYNNYIWCYLEKNPVKFSEKSPPPAAIFYIFHDNFWENFRRLRRRSIFFSENFYWKNDALGNGNIYFVRKSFWIIVVTNDVNPSCFQTIWLGVERFSESDQNDFEDRVNPEENTFKERNQTSAATRFVS